MWGRKLAAVALVAVALPATAQEVIEGRLEAGDQQLSMNEYYDVYTFEGAQGQAFRFEVVSGDFLPGGMLIDPAGNQIYQSLGSAIDKVWSLQCRLTASGTWQLAVFQSFWLEGNYTLTVTPLAAAADVRACNE